MSSIKNWTPCKFAFTASYAIEITKILLLTRKKHGTSISRQLATHYRALIQFNAMHVCMHACLIQCNTLSEFYKLANLRQLKCFALGCGRQLPNHIRWLRTFRFKTLVHFGHKQNLRSFSEYVFHQIGSPTPRGHTVYEVYCRPQVEDLS